MYKGVIGRCGAFSNNSDVMVDVHRSCIVLTPTGAQNPWPTIVCNTDMGYMEGEGI